MRILWVFSFLHTVFADNGFGSSYLGNSKLCQPWTCLNRKLGFQDHLPPRDQFKSSLRLILPKDSWQDLVDDVTHICYDDRPRRYTNTCPGQSLMHCMVEQLIQNCPEHAHRRADACSPVSSLAGFKYMFSQSLYTDLEKNLPIDSRPSWFLKNYFNTKCCNLPPLFSPSDLHECGFSAVLRYYEHGVKPSAVSNNTKVNKFEMSTKPTYSTTSTVNNEKSGHVQGFVDPLDCCDMSEFVRPSYRSECRFDLQWDTERRLVISNEAELSTSTTVAPTTTMKPDNDMKIVPETCEKVECVFKKLNIVSEFGSVDVDAFSNLLNNMTNEHPEWVKAKARVVTKCLSKPVTDYEADCEINKVFSCVLDVLSENCPFAKKNDPCKHSSTLRNGIMCQISSSKYRPKNRRQFCGVPNLVNYKVMSQCGVGSIGNVVLVEAPRVRSATKKHIWINTYKCNEITESTKCLMNKMGILNKYGFMDYFRMKDIMRRFTTDNTQWSSLSDVYMNAFTETPMYQEHCNSPKKLLNVIDSMLATCPVSKRKNTQQCQRVFESVANTQPDNIKRNVTKVKLAQLLGHYHHIFLPTQPIIENRPIPKPKYIIEKKPRFNFWLLGNNPPPVRTIDVKPNVSNKPLILLPVYARTSNAMSNISLSMGNRLSVNLSLRPNNGLFKSASYLLRNRLSDYNLTTPSVFE